MIPQSIRIRIFFVEQQELKGRSFQTNKLFRLNTATEKHKK